MCVTVSNGRKGAKFGTTDILFVVCPRFHPYLRTTKSTSSRQTTVSVTTANSAETLTRSSAPVSTKDRSGVGALSDCQKEQSQIVLPTETEEQLSLSSGLSDVPWLNQRSHGTLYSNCIIKYEQIPSSSSFKVADCVCLILQYLLHGGH